MNGTFILIIGPSGSGKGTLLSFLRKRFRNTQDVIFPVSCTTRPMRPGEKDGETYYFISRDEFEERVDRDAFLEWAEYGGNLYGTLRSEIVEPLKEGRVVVREVEAQGVRSMLSLFPRMQLKIVYIDAGSWNEFEQRIRNRAPITDEELAGRRRHYEDEVTLKEVADEVISNREGELASAKQRLTAIVRNAVNDTSREH